MALKRRALLVSAGVLLLGGLVWAAVIEVQSRDTARPDHGDPCVSGETEVTKAANQVHLDEQAIQHFGLQVRGQEIDDLLAQTAESQQEFDKQSFEALRTLTFAAAEKFLETPGAYNPASLNPWNVNNTVKSLADKGLLTPEVEKGLRWIASQKQKRDAMLAGVKTVEVGIDSAQMSSTQKLEALKDALGWFTGPVGSLITASGDATVGFLFAAHAKFATQDEIERMSTLSEANLQELHRLSELMKRDVETLRRARADHKKCSTENPARTYTSWGKTGFRVHWTQYPAQPGEAFPLILDVGFRSLKTGESDGLVAVSNGSQGAPTGNMYLPAPVDFIEVEPGEYTVTVQVSKSYIGVPWGFENQNPPQIIDQPEDGYKNPLMIFKAKVERGKTTEIFPLLRHNLRPPVEMVTSHVYDPKDNSVTGLSPPSYSEFEAYYTNQNRRNFHEPLVQVHVLRSQNVSLGLGAFREIVPECPIDGKK